MIYKLTIKNLYMVILSTLFITFIQLFRENIFIFELIFITTFTLYIFLFRKNDFNIITFFLFFEFLMPPVPTKVTIAPILFVIFGIILLLYTIHNQTITIRKNLTSIVLILSLIFLVFIILYSNLLAQNSIITILISLIPFIMYLYILFIIDAGIKNENINVINLFNSIYIWGMLYVINNYSLLAYNLLSGKSLSDRITLLDYNTLSPVPLLLLSIIAYKYINEIKESKKNKMIAPLMMFIFISTIIPLTRSYILASLLILLIVYVAIIVNLKFFKMLFVIVISFVILLISNRYSILAPIIKRFESASNGDDNVSERFIEYEIALNAFIKNPFFGIGIGTKFNERHGEMVNYIHSFFFYTIANTGIIGLLLFIFIVIFLILTLVSAKQWIVKGIMLAGLIIIFYSFFFAIYKWFSFGILSGIIIWVIVNRNYIENQIRKINL